MQAADSVMAIADDLLSRRLSELGDALGQLGQRQEHAVRQPRQLVFSRLAHVDEQRLLPAFQVPGKLLDGDLARHDRLLERAQPRSRLRIVRRTVS